MNTQQRKNFPIEEKMKTVAIYFMLLLMSSPLLAQDDRKRAYDKEKLESAKVAFITRRLDLTSAQAEAFWPKYNKHNETKWKIIRSINDLVDFEGEISEQKARDLIDQKFDMEQQILDLEKAFLKDIIKVISPVQALKLGEANRDFARHIYRMQKRKKTTPE